MSYLKFNHNFYKGNKITLKSGRKPRLLYVSLSQSVLHLYFCMRSNTDYSDGSQPETRLFSWPKMLICVLLSIVWPYIGWHFLGVKHVLMKESFFFFLESITYPINGNIIMVLFIFTDNLLKQYEFNHKFINYSRCTNYKKCRYPINWKSCILRAYLCVRAPFNLNVDTPSRTTKSVVYCTIWSCCPVLNESNVSACILLSNCFWNNNANPNLIKIEMHAKIFKCLQT